MVHDDGNPTPSPLFKESTSVLKNESMLMDSYQPEVIVARDGQIQEIADNLTAILRKGEATNMYLRGDIGTGKTISAKHVFNELKRTIKAFDRDIFIDVVNVDCTVTKSEVTVAHTILEKLSPIHQKTGLQFFQYLQQIWQIIENRANQHSYYSLILFFDEVDQIEKPENILYQFSRAVAHQKFNAKNVNIGVVIATNNRNFLTTLRENVRSSAKFKTIKFPNYNERELFDILHLRKDAFEDNVLDDDIIHYCAHIVADNYNGDARHAIDILYEAAKIIMKENRNHISLEDIENANKKLLEKLTVKELKGIPLHDRLLILSIYLSNKMLRQYKSSMPTHTGVVLSVYQDICRILDLNANHSIYMSSRIKALNDQNYIEAKVVRGFGNTKFITLIEDVECIIHEIISESNLKTIENSYSDLEISVLSKVQRP